MESTHKEPWPMTSSELLLVTNQPKFNALRRAIQEGIPITVATGAGFIRLSDPAQLVLNSSGCIQLPQGKSWLRLTHAQIDDMLRQAGI